MRAVIIGNGNLLDSEFIRLKINDDDFIICADGGYNRAVQMGIRVDVIIGDLDSIADFDNEIEVIKYPAKKDFTDGELCIDYAIKKGFDEILLLCMSSSRIDHTINNIFMMSKCKKAMMADEKNEIYILNDNLKITNKKGKILSIIPIKNDLEGITTNGLEYPLKNETLFFGECRGNSNIINDDLCTISIKKGIGIVVVTFE